MHSSGMCTACLLTISHHALWWRVYLPWGLYLPMGCLPRGVHAQGGACPGGRGGCLGVDAKGVPAKGVPCDLSHHAFEVTCMLPPHQLRHINSAPAYIVLSGHVTCKACWDTTHHLPPPHGQTDTCKNITFANYICRQ